MALDLDILLLASHLRLSSPATQNIFYLYLSKALPLSTRSSFKLALISLYLKQANLFISGAFSYLDPVGNKHETALGFLQAALPPQALWDLPHASFSTVSINTITFWSLAVILSLQSSIPNLIFFLSFF